MARWDLAAKARNDFADLIDSLSPEQLEQQSLCDQWTAQGVLAHLTAFVETGGLALFGNIFKAGFNFDKASVAMAEKRIGRPTSELTASLRKNATKSAPLPTFPEELTVSDVAIHTQDVRRPLGLDGALDETVLRTALDFLTSHKHATTLVNRPPLDGVRLQATDLDWSFGDGDEVGGTAEALMMGLANRPVLDELAGGGVARWA